MSGTDPASCPIVVGEYLLKRYGSQFVKLVSSAEI
jgi:hypothetical protein